MKTALELKEVTMINTGFILKDINFVLPQGAIMGVIGRNGVGKTSLMKTILGGYTTLKGEINFFENTLDDKWDTLLESIGYMSDDFYVNEHFKVKRFMKNYQQIYKTFNEQTFLSYLQQSNIDVNKRINELSLGQIKLVELYANLSRDSKILISDEPMANLDPIARREISELLNPLC